MSLPDYLIEDDRQEEPVCTGEIYTCRCPSCLEWWADIVTDREYND